MRLKAELIFQDRVGIVADVSSTLAGLGLNILSMEVTRKSSRAHLYLETDINQKVSGWKDILENLGDTPDLVDIRFIDTLPQEERENRFRVVLDNISDGVVSIDRDGLITTINRVAREVLQCEEKKVVGRSVRELKLPDFSILECLEGKVFHRVKKNLITATGRYQYIATGGPIRDSEGRIIGAVEIAKDMLEIKQLARSITDPEEVGFSDIIGKTPAITAAIAFAERIADSDAIVSVRGQSGTGKELFARAIHSASGRKGAFVPINCAALPETLLESELFGYASGAFTGGRKEGRPGLFETARNGTIFLDEIAEMAPGCQAKILRVIQEKRVRRIGGSKEIPVDARVITATNRRLEQLVEDKRFRQDLYYRINVLPIHIPPLSERMDDISPLVEHFLFQLSSGLGKPLQPISESALDKLRRHHWPGNVRELKNVVERAAILAEARPIDQTCIVFSHELDPSPPCQGTGDFSADRTARLRPAVEAFEKNLITESLARFPSIRAAARALGISHTALLNKLQKHQIIVETK
jgi:transcriptional regulator of aroF, aroG, tyrA and aromatic amino acid transport